MSFKLIGPDVLSYSLETFYYLTGSQNTDPTNTIFPLLIKCVFKNHGLGGGIQVKPNLNLFLYSFLIAFNIQGFDTICILTRMKWVDKFYLFLHIWWVLLATLFLIQFLCLLLQIAPEQRGLCLGLGCSLKLSKLVKIARNLSYSDWFLLTIIKANTDRICFDSAMEKLAAKIDR